MNHKPSYRQPGEASRDDALRKLAAACAKAECCTGDMEEKMRRWGLGDDDIRANIEYLVSHKYVDDTRYCRAFVNDKITYNHWGRRKIEQGLWLKHIAPEVYEPILDEVAEERYAEVLAPLLKAKWPNIKAASDYERSGKLIKFAMGRGFELDVIKKCINRLALSLADTP